MPGPAGARVPRRTAVPRGCASATRPAALVDFANSCGFCLCGGPAGTNADPKNYQCFKDLQGFGELARYMLWFQWERR